jgi:subtilase family serine protease
MDLAAGAGFQFTVTVTGVTPGTGSLSVDADHFNAITEFSETNNSVTETTTINP